MTFIPLKREDVQINVYCLEEDAPVKGNALCSGDEAIDKAEEQRILRALVEGCRWAWCCVKVEACYAGFEATEYLGCCSYESKDDFIENSGYYEDMVETCLENLNEQLKDFYAREGRRMNK